MRGAEESVIEEEMTGVFETVSIETVSNFNGMIRMIRMRFDSTLAWLGHWCCTLAPCSDQQRTVFVDPSFAKTCWFNPQRTSRKWPLGQIQIRAIPHDGKRFLFRAMLPCGEWVRLGLTWQCLTTCSRTTAA